MIPETRRMIGLVHEPIVAMQGPLDLRIIY
jgi:hypothetical protein